MKSIWSFTEGYRKYIALIVCLLLLQVYGDLSLPGYTAQIINIGIVNGDVSYVSGVGARMMLTSLLILFCAICVSFVSSRLGAAVSHRLRERIFAKVLSFSGEEMERFSTASLITRSTNDVQQVQMLIMMTMRMVVYAPLMGIGGVIRILNTNHSMAWIIAVGVGILLMFVAALLRLTMPKFRIMQKLIDKVNLVTREILTGIPVIRAFSRERFEEKRFDKANLDLMKTMMFTNRVMALTGPIMTLIMNGLSLAIIRVGADHVMRGNLLAGDIVAYNTYAMQIIMSFLMLTIMSIMLPRALVSADRIAEVLDAQPAVTDDEKTTPYPEAPARVCFRGVSFRYPGAEKNTLSDITFSAEPGETTAIIGSTGSGKSTLMHLLLRLYDVSEGSIELAGTDIRRLEQKELREHIGFVPQKGLLFSGTIKSNLLYGKADASQEDMRQAADIACAAAFIEEKPDGYETAVAQGGTNVSGGQRQRLAIARAIVKNPDIYVFDDSFSALDYKTDAALRRALAKRTKDKTVLIVAQRISTILHAEKIVVLDKGRIAGIGTHEELLASCAQYREIAEGQLTEQELGSVKGR